MTLCLVCNCTARNKRGITLIKFRKKNPKATLFLGRAVYFGQCLNCNQVQPTPIQCMGQGIGLKSEIKKRHDLKNHDFISYCIHYVYDNVSYVIEFLL